MTTKRSHSNAWYREPWPWLLMSGPALAVIAGAATLWLAVTSYDGLVADDYYKQGLAINQALQRDAQARRLGLHAALRLDSAGNQIGVRMRGALASESEMHELKLRVTHPTIPGRDQVLTLHRADHGEFLTSARVPVSGRWLISLEDVALTWRLIGEWRAENERTVELAPAAER